MKVDGGPAFPYAFHIESEKEIIVNPGMTLRDYFAAAAIAPILVAQCKLAEHGVIKDYNTVAHEIAVTVYDLVDAMLAERAKGVPE